jgi:hypothetical protein
MIFTVEDYLKHHIHGFLSHFQTTLLHDDSSRPFVSIRESNLILEIYSHPIKHQ